MKVALLCALLVVAVCAEGFFPAADVSELDQSVELNGDSPVRQSQRLRTTERADRSAQSESEADAEFDTSSFLEASADAKHVPGPALDRLTGAAKTFHPNDQMCVLCQFLVQRTQLDMAHFNAVGQFNGAKTAGAGGAANAATGGSNAGEKSGGDDAFIELASAFGGDSEDSEAWAEQDAEDAQLMEIAAKQELAESEGDWDAVAALEQQAKAVTADSDENESDSEDESEDESEEAKPTAAFSETASSVSTGLSSEEQAEMAEVMSELRDDTVADSVQSQIDAGMKHTPVMVETESASASAADEEDMIEEEVTTDSVSNGERKSFLNVLGEKFDSELDLSADEVADLSAGVQTSEELEAEDPFQTPSYNADGSSESFTEASETVEAITSADQEDMSLLQIESVEEDESEDESEDAAEMADNIQFIEVASNPTAPRSYARTLHVAESEPIAPVLAEMSGQHRTFQSAGGRAQVASQFFIDRNGRRRVGVANSPRRFRLADALNGRPRWNRWDPTVMPHPNAQRQQAREQWHRLMQMTYDRLEGYCSTRLPEQFTPFCRPLLRRFRVVAEGIRYGDRPNQICMRTKFCPRGSYVRRSPHNVFKHVVARSESRME